MGIARFQDLKSWQEARKLVQVVYRLTRKGQFREDRGMSWQIQDAAVSAMGNIAEAHGRYSFEDKRRFLDVSLGSCMEAQSHLYAARDVGHITNEEFEEAHRQTEVVAQLLSGSLDNLDRQIADRPTPKSGQRRRR